MQDKQPNHYDLTRRKVLAGLGTVGVASAGAGLGTSAYFSDREDFKDNTLTAGALDLKVDWEEHYYWDQINGLDVQRTQPSDSEDYVGMPDPADPLVWVHKDDLGTFMDNTSIEAYPDADDDSVQDDLEQYDSCQDFADTPEDLDPSKGLRTKTDDTLTANGDPAPLINLHDVKPGDFGELTLSFHLCDNPGYVWLNGALGEVAENGHTEPERKDPDESGASDSTDPADVELLDAVETMLWYDEDGDNVFEPGGAKGKADVVIALDRSGSMQGSPMDDAKEAAKTLVDALGGAAQVGVVSFAKDASLDQGLTTNKSDAKSAIDAISPIGPTNIEGGVRQSHEELLQGDQFGAYGESGKARPAADKIMVLLSDGKPNVDDDGDGDTDPTDEATAAKNDGVELFTVAFGDADKQMMEDMASDPKDSHAYVGKQEDLVNIFGQIGKIISGEERFFRGSLRELLSVVGQDNGIPLDGNRGTAYEEVDSGDPNDGADPNREAFVNSTNNFIGLAWWLPVDHANEIQTDSVSFDLGFYTEQARHNDGSGLAQSSP